jgi:rod shape-determining protein MreD
VNRLLRYLFFGLAAAVLQTTLVPILSLAGQRPDLVVLFAVAVGAFEGASLGSTAGFLLGLLVDLHHPPTMGGGAMGGALAGWLWGKARDLLDLGLPLDQLITFVAARLAHDLLYDGVAALKGYGNLGTLFFGHALGGAVLTALLGMAVLTLAGLLGAGRYSLDRR